MDSKKPKEVVSDKVTKSAISGSGNTGGLLVGRRHSEGGIKAVNKSNGQPIEMEGGEVVITRNAVSDNKKREFQGEMLTNREILSRINQSGGGVAIFEEGGEMTGRGCSCKGHKYNYGGRMMSDYDILKDMNKSDEERMYEMQQKYRELPNRVYKKGGNIDFVNLDECAKSFMYEIKETGLHHMDIDRKKKSKLKELEEGHYLYFMPSKSFRCLTAMLTDNGKKLLKSLPPLSMEHGGKMECGCGCGTKYKEGGNVKKGLLIASSPTLEGITKIIGDYYYSPNITLKKIDGTNEYEVHNSKGKISSVKVIENKGRFQFLEAETETQYTYFKGVDHDYRNQFEINKAIEELLENFTDEELSVEEKNFLTYYSGYGGLEKFGATGKGLLYEYFTPSIISKKMWALAYKHGFGEGYVLEPSCGIGEFIKYAPEQTMVDAYEINKVSARISKILYPQANIKTDAFETIFIKKNSSIKDKTDSLKKYSLVIGNPPYGTMSGLYAGMGEKDYAKANNYIDYFILRGLDLLESGGLLIYVIGVEVAAGGTPFLQQGLTKNKEMIMDRAELVDAYRLPNGVFERTDVLTDIVVFKKK